MNSANSWTKFNTFSINRLTSRHVGILVDGRRALGDTRFKSFIKIRIFRMTALSMALACLIVCYVWVGTTINTLSHRIPWVSIIKRIHFHRIAWTYIDTSLSIGIRIISRRTNWNTSRYHQITVSEETKIRVTLLNAHASVRISKHRAWTSWFTCSICQIAIISRRTNC